MYLKYITYKTVYFQKFGMFIQMKFFSGEKEEIWPGFNLRLPTLSEYFCDHDYDKQGNNESIWQMPAISTSNCWFSEPANGSVQQLPTSSAECNYLTESLRSFMLNPEAPPLIENSSKSRTTSTNLTMGYYYLILINIFDS